MIVLPIITGLIGVGQSYLNNVIGQNVMQDLRGALYAHLQSMPLRFFTETRTGEIQSRLANDIGGVQAVVTDTASSVTSNLAIAISTTIAMFLLDWRLALLSLALTPFFLYLTYRVGKVRREVSTETQKSLAEMTATTEETLSVSGILLSKTFGQQANAIEKFRGQNRQLAKLQIRQAMVGRWFFMIIGSIFSIMPAFVYWLAGTLAANGSPGRAVGRHDRGLHHAPEPPLLPARPAAQHPGRDPGLARAVRPDLRVPRDGPRDRGRARRGRRCTRPRPAARSASATSRSSTRRPRSRRSARTTRSRAASRANRSSSSSSRRRPPPRPEPAEPDPRAACVAFNLEHIDFEAEPGQLVALVGPSGAGKTTTTYLVSRLYDVDSGAVEIDDVDVRRIKLASLGEIIGAVTQETYLFHASVRDNLRYARPEASEDELITAATAASIHERVMELPEGYDTIVGERGYKLSGGEKQRLAIARVLLKDPRILILDEATSALDTVSERLIQRAFERLMEGRTTIAIAHRLSTILRADQIIVYERGEVVERGTHAELLALDGLYARLYQRAVPARGDDRAATARSRPSIALAGV